MDADSPVKPPSAKVVNEIVRRYIKEDKTPDWRTDRPIFFALWKQYPSVDFWTHHELPFKLNSLLWFRTKEGAAKLESDWTIYHYTPSNTADTVDNLDTLTQSSEYPVEQPMKNTDQPAPPVARKPPTIAEFIRNKTI